MLPELLRKKKFAATRMKTVRYFGLTRSFECKIPNHFGISVVPATCIVREKHLGIF